MQIAVAGIVAQTHIPEPAARLARGDYTSYWTNMKKIAETVACPGENHRLDIEGSCPAAVMRIAAALAQDMGSPQSLDFEFLHLFLAPKSAIS